MSGQAGDTGECPDRDRALTTQIADLQQKLARLTLENARLTQERDNLNVELLNVKASQEGPTDPNDPDENQDISSDKVLQLIGGLWKWILGSLVM